MDYINKKEQTIGKKDHMSMTVKLNRMLKEESLQGKKFHPENFFCSNKPTPLKEARIKKKLGKNIEGHIIVCGIVKGIKNLILPLRSKILGSQRRPIIILSNESMGEEKQLVSGDMYIWDEINKFEEIYTIRGSALNPQDLEKAMVSKAKAVIILAKSYENSTTQGQNLLDADAIFMYKTIEANYKSIVTVTEMASMGNIAFLVNGTDDKL
jgi:potassium large conductance calcium-activated channel subfamily M alpha protein 1